MDVDSEVGWHKLDGNVADGVRDFLASVQFSHSVVSDSLWPHRLQHARLTCPSPTPRAYSNSSPSSRWCHSTISSSVVPFSSRLQSFPAKIFICSQLGWNIAGRRASQVVLVVKNLPANAGDGRAPGSIPGSGRRAWKEEGMAGGGHGNPLQYSCLENPMDRGACRAMGLGVAKSRTQPKRQHAQVEGRGCSV